MEVLSSSGHRDQEFKRQSVLGRFRRHQHAEDG